jgi:hypothetical protein
MADARVSLAIEATPVHRRKIQLCESARVRRRAIALMRTEPVAGILPVQPSQELVARLLGND